MLTPEKIHQDVKAYHEEEMELLKKNPWLIPATMALSLVPVALGIHGFWKNRQLHNQLKIECERTKQLAIKSNDLQGLHSN